MADDREYKELEAGFEAYFAIEPADDNRDKSCEPSEEETAEAFERYLCYNNILPPMNLIACLREDILKIYNEEKIKIKGILSSLDGQISISAEMLRDLSCNDYLCLKAHFIDENWELKEWVLRYHALPMDFASGITKGLSVWGIEDKVSTITLKTPLFIDYIDEMAETVKEEVQKKKTLQLGGRLFHLYCCAELLNQMVQEVAFKKVFDTIDKIKLLIWWGKSEPMWHLTTSRVKMAIEMRSSGEFDSVEPSEVPSVEEWKNVEGVCKVVDLIDGVAKFLFLNKNQTPCDFLGKTSEAVKSDDFLKGVIEEMVKRLDEYLKNMFLVLAIATVMDPRCKMHYIKFICSKTEVGDFSTVLDAVRSLYISYLSVPNHKSKMEEEEESSTEKPEEGGNVKVNEKNDLDLYLEDPVLTWSQDFNLLSWWKESKSKYPTLARMARDLLPIPWLSITSYDAYYTEERMVDMYMASNGQKLMNAVLCARSWLSGRS